VKTATLDTNVLPVDDLIEHARQRGIRVVVTSVTEREMGSNELRSEGSGLGHSMETAVLGESVLGSCVLGEESDANCLESVLQIISNGSFPGPCYRKQLTDGQRRQLRDAMILCTHVRDRREVFVTDDRKAFINDGRREALQNLLGTRIVTREEFLHELQVHI